MLIPGLREYNTVSWDPKILWDLRTGRVCMEAGMLPKIGLHVLSIYIIYKEIKYIPHHCLATFTTISSKCAHCCERFGKLNVVYKIIKTLYLLWEVWEMKCSLSNNKNFVLENTFYVSMSFQILAPPINKENKHDLTTPPQKKNAHVMMNTWMAIHLSTRYTLY